MSCTPSSNYECIVYEVERQCHDTVVYTPNLQLLACYVAIATLLFSSSILILRD